MKPVIIITEQDVINLKQSIEDALEFKDPIPEVKVTKVSYDDGKTWIELE